MPIYKFKDFETAEHALWNIKVDAEYLLRLNEFYELKIYLSKKKHPIGIFKYKTLEDANKAEDEMLVNSAVEILRSFKKCEASDSKI